MIQTKHTKGIVVSYIVAQFAAILIYPLSLWLAPNQNDFLLASISTTLSFILGFILMLYLVRDEWKPMLQGSFFHAFIYGLVGFMVAIIGQVLLGLIIQLFSNGGVDNGTEQYVLEMAEFNIAFIAIPMIIGPILEEFVFRYVLLGKLMKRMNTVIAVLLSSFIFGLLHFSLINLIIYMFCGVIFSLVYIRTKNILAPIMAHIFMNSYVLLALLFS